MQTSPTTMSNRASSDTLTQILIVVGLIFAAAFVFKLAFGLLAFAAPLVLLALAGYVLWRFVQKVQAKR